MSSNNVLALAIIYCSALSHSAFAYIYSSWLRKKPVGMQTLYDQAIIAIIHTHSILAWNFAFYCTLALKQDWNEHFAAVLAFLLVWNNIGLGLVLVAGAIVRFLSIAYFALVNEFQEDGKIMRLVLLLCFSLSLIITGIDFGFYADIKLHFIVQRMTGHTDEPTMMPKSVFIVYGIVFVALGALQVYIEKRHRKRNNLLVQFVPCWPEEEEEEIQSEADDIQGIRIYVVFVYICSAMFTIPLFAHRRDVEGNVPLRPFLQFITVNLLDCAFLWHKRMTLKSHITNLVAAIFDRFNLELE